jgi:hypothetical protein
MRNVRPGRAQDLERGDRAAPRLQVRGHAIADADPGDKQRGERHQRQELPHARHEAIQAGRCLVARAQFQPGIGKLVRQGVGHALGRREGGQAQAVFPPHHGAGLDQAGGIQPGAADDHGGAKRKAFAQPVGLVADHAADAEGGLADAQALAGRHAQPLGHARRDPGGARVGGAGSAAIGQRERAIERPCLIDGLEFDRHGGAIGAGHGGHGAHPCPDRQAPGAGESGLLGGKGLAPGDFHLDIPAQHGLPTPIEFAAHRLGQGADRRQRGHAQHQAHDQDAQATEFPVQPAPGEGPGPAPAQLAAIRAGAALIAFRRWRCAHRPGAGCARSAAPGLHHA